ncbi:MAG: NfeD family protein [Clostridia bacterium]|nr:NfeD family protein [Clostridia bacterium]
MAIIEWWNSLSLAAQIFYCIALPSTLVLLVQTILMFIGLGEDADGDVDVDTDVGADVDADVDVDLDGDIPDGDEGFLATVDAEGFAGLRVFTVRGIIAFLVVFGWVGVVMETAGITLWLTLPVATASGFAIMLLLAFIFKALMKLRSDGNTDNRNAIGTAGRVHLTIPPSRTGEGKVHVMLQGSYVERDAVTDEDTPIPTGSEIVVVRVSGGTTLVVRRK